MHVYWFFNKKDRFELRTYISWLDRGSIRLKIILDIYFICPTMGLPLYISLYPYTAEKDILVLVSQFYVLSPVKNCVF